MHAYMKILFLLQVWNAGRRVVAAPSQILVGDGFFSGFWNQSLTHKDIYDGEGLFLSS